MHGAVALPKQAIPLHGTVQLDSKASIIAAYSARVPRLRCARTPLPKRLNLGRPVFVGPSVFSKVFFPPKQWMGFGARPRLG